jgi:hypothetical protein
MFPLDFNLLALFAEPLSKTPFLLLENEIGDCQVLLLHSTTILKRRDNVQGNMQVRCRMEVPKGGS